MPTIIRGLADLTSAQANKHVTINNNNRRVEAVRDKVLSKSNGGPPASPADQDAYIIDVASGAWASFTVNNIAQYISGAWYQYPAQESLRVWVADIDQLHVYTGSAWVELASTSLGLSSLTDGSVIFVGSGELQEDNSNFSYNGSTNTMTVANVTVLNGLTTSSSATFNGPIVANGSLTLDNGGSNLSWYEEGTFTPEVYGSTVAGVGTYSGAAAGKFTRIGNVVVFLITYDLTAHTGTGNIRVRTLPYAAANNTVVNVFASNLTFPDTHLQWFIVGQEIWANNVSSGGGDAYIAMDTAHQVVISGYYLV